MTFRPLRGLHQVRLTIITCIWAKNIFIYMMVAGNTVLPLVVYNFKSLEYPEVSEGKHIQRLSTLRFIPCKNVVPRSLIHLLSLIFCRVGSSLCNWSITITAMSPTECAALLKCTATGDSSVLRCTMSDRWPFILQWRGWPVSPTYWWPHLLHSIR